jgi:WD40 repeat protein
MARIFISYRHVEPDQTVAKFLHHYLSNLDHEVFYDKEGLTIGSLWDKEITNSVEHAQWFIPIVSLAYLNSQYILDKELSPAAKLFKQGKIERILQVNMAYDGKPPEAVAEVVEQVHFFKWKSPADTPSLAENISKIIPLPQIMVKGMRPFTETDWTLFQNLGRHEEITRCLELLKDDSIRYAQIHGVSGAGKTSFIRAGLVPSLKSGSAEVVELQEDSYEAPKSHRYIEYIFLDQFEQTLIRLSKNDKLLRSFPANLKSWFDAYGEKKIIFCIRDEYRTPFDAMLPEISKDCSFFPLLPLVPEVASSVLSALLNNARIEHDQMFLPHLCQELAESVPKTVTPAILQLIAQYCKNHELKLNKGSWDQLLLGNRSIFEDHVKDAVINRLPRRIPRLDACISLAALTSGEVKSQSKTAKEIAEGHKVNLQDVEDTLDIALRPQARVVTLEASEEDGEQRYRLVHDLFAPAILAIHREAKRRRESRLRVAVISALSVLLIATVIALVIAKEQRDNAKTQQQHAEEVARVAKLQEREIRQNNYVISMKLAQKSYDEKSLLRASEILSGLTPGLADQGEDLREFYWRYLFKLLRDEKLTLNGRSNYGISDIVVSDDGRFLTGRDHFGGVKRWDLSTGDEVSAWVWEGNVQATFGRPADVLVKISPDGKDVASVDTSNEVTLRDIATGRELCKLKQPTPVVGLQFLSNDKILGTAGYDNAIRLWSIPSGELVKTFTAPEYGKLRLMAAAEDGNALVAGYEHAPWVVIDISKREVSGKFACSDRSDALAISADGKMLVCQTEAGDVTVFTSNGQKVATLSDEWQAAGLTFSPDGKFLARGKINNRAGALWNTRSGKKMYDLPGATSPVTFSPDGTMLATGGENKTIKLWNVSDGGELQSLSGHAADINKIIFVKDSKTLVSASEDATAKLWTIDQTVRRESELKLDTAKNLGPVAISADGGVMAAKVGPKAVKVWGARDGKELMKVELGEVPYEFIEGLALSADGSRLAISVHDKGVLVWDVRRQSELIQIRTESETSGLKLSGDGSTVAWAERTIKSGGEATHIRMEDVNQGRGGTELVDDESNRMREIITAIDMATDGKTVGFQTLGGFVKVWNLRGAQPALTSVTYLKDLIAYLPQKRFIVVSADGNVVATLGSTNVEENSDKEIVLWDVKNRKRVAFLKGHKGSINAISFSPDGRTLASGSQDGTVRLWDLRSMQELVTFGPHGEPVVSVMFTQDGTKLLSVSSDGVVKSWLAATEAEMKAQSGR